MAYVCYHALTDEEKVIVAKRFKQDLFASDYIQQDLADMLEIAQSTVAAWVNGRLLIPLWRAFTLQKKTDGVFRVEHLRPDFVRAFQEEINALEDAYYKPAIDAILAMKAQAEEKTEVLHCEKKTILAAVERRSGER